VTTNDGTELVLEISGVPIGNDLLVTLVDVTERVRAEASWSMRPWPSATGVRARAPVSGSPSAWP